MNVCYRCAGLILRSAVTMLLAAVAMTAVAQGNNAFNSARVSGGTTDHNAFNRARSKGNFNDYRTSLNAEYARMLREGWPGYDKQKGQKAPDHDTKPVPPRPWQGDDNRQDKPINIDDVVRPIKDNNRAAPIAPVKEDPTITTTDLSFVYFGTQMKVRVPAGGRFSIGAGGAGGVADAWMRLSTPEYAATVADCQKLRSRHQLCDWAYLEMLDRLSRAYASDANSATLLMAYLYSQSGYKIRLGESGPRLVMLYATRHKLYNAPYFTLDDDKFYPYGDVQDRVYITDARFPKEQSLSLWIPGRQDFGYAATPDRTLTSKRYPQFSVTVSGNKNLIDFFNTYPTSEVGGNFMTRWAMYANTPTGEQMRSRLYPQLKSLLNGLDELEAVERLLNWVQTAFVYEYDNKVWGRDRAFFPEETLYYPYCDCEDRSILFTRLVRDLLGLKCLLIYYPGHLAAAVAFNSNVGGDYIMQGGRKFVVTDPTYIGARVGRTMPDMDNASANVILLE